MQSFKRDRDAFYTLVLAVEITTKLYYQLACTNNWYKTNKNIFMYVEDLGLSILYNSIV